ncbi:MAG: hypothetical protein PHY02_01960 [Phycisphaerae bacterium]|nr:hypothetical protein [Phycisphaerae bacterium]
MAEGKITKRKITRMCWVFIVLAVTTLTGCMTMKMEMGGRPLTKKNIAKIESGRTTKDDIIQWFGMPKSVSKPNQSDQSTNVNIPNFAGAPGVRDLFEFFSSKHKITETHRVYYYYYVHSDSAGVLFFHEWKQRQDELFILIDESTQLVVDYMFVPDKH